MKFLNTYNESIRQFLKPKSEDKILKELNKLSDGEKFKKSCKYGLTSVIKNLIDNGFDPSYDNNYGIQIASSKGNLDVVKLLLKDERIDPSVNNNNSIRNASLNGHLDVVKELLKDKRVDPSDSGNFAIKYSSQNGYIDIIKELLKDERVTSKLSKEDLIKYQKQVEGINESIRQFLKPKSKQDILKEIENLTDEEKFENACKFGITWLVKNLIDNGFDPSERDNHGLKLSSEYGHSEVVKELLKDKRVNPTVNNNFPLLLSSCNGNLDVVKELLKDKRVDPSDNDIIIYASENGHIEVVKEFLKDKRVTDKLSKNDLIKYQKQISGLNESIRQFLKPKTEDEIKNKLDKLPLPERINTIIKYKLYSQSDIIEMINSLPISELKNILLSNILVFNYLTKDNLEKIYPIVTQIYNMVKSSPFWKIKNLRDYKASQYVNDSQLTKLRYNNTYGFFYINLYSYDLKHRVTIKIHEDITGELYVRFGKGLIDSWGDTKIVFNNIEEFFHILQTNSNFPEPLRKYFTFESTILPSNIDKMEHWIRKRRNELGMNESIKDFLKPKSEESIFKKH